MIDFDFAHHLKAKFQFSYNIITLSVFPHIGDKSAVFIERTP